MINNTLNIMDFDGVQFFITFFYTGLALSPTFSFDPGLIVDVPLVTALEYDPWLVLLHSLTDLCKTRPFNASNLLILKASTVPCLKGLYPVTVAAAE